ncbi:MAG TPA: hypothetical protein VFE46_03785 [Pirellulales bacterium]|jgi:hypothetical protein|nr:hypothetical protein [Pirellulales bacterium]
MTLGNCTLREKQAATSLGLLLGVIFALGGCGQRNPLERLPVYGAVALASDEKLSGSITFVPAEGRAGPAATASIVDGRYQFDAENGPTPGPSRVLVKRNLPKGALSLEMAKEKMSKDTAAAEKAAKAKTAVEKAAIQNAAEEEDAKYDKQFRSDWTFTLDLSADKPYQHDFTLEQ